MLGTSLLLALDMEAISHSLIQILGLTGIQEYRKFVPARSE